MPKIQIKLKDRETAEKTGSVVKPPLEENGKSTGHDKVTELNEGSEASPENEEETDSRKDNTDKEDRGRRFSDSEEEPLVESEPGLSSIIGFDGFGSTKNKKVNGNDAFGARKLPKTEYRQYMNREKGFNRPLSPPRKKKK
ncbi:hypothetical protein KL937_002140 [Ogataea polymorpha]|nr:hypothetical protein KL937_002140 [Ogataea polymorpha]KAG7936010.1 hypothetical protein KL904_002658 [Ogataea polymorpha]